MAAASATILSEAVWPQDRFVVETMFREYVAGLGVRLDFQNFDEELAGLPGKYARPDGLALIARLDGEVAAVGCYRPFTAKTCEMKRLYVRPQFRGHGLGRLLAVRLIEEARTAGHEAMLLDSLASMAEAQALYRSLGFEVTSAYYDNPLKGVVYMRRPL